LDQIRYYSGAQRLTAAGAAVLTCVTEVGDHGRDPASARAATGISQKNDFQNVLVNWRTGRLDEIDVASAHVLLDLNMELGVGKAF
jgi:hypothetical protein